MMIDETIQTISHKTIFVLVHNEHVNDNHICPEAGTFCNRVSLWALNSLDI